MLEILTTFEWFYESPYHFFAEAICWTRTAERQTSRIKMEYLRSVLRQEVAFFDNQSASSNTFQVVSTVSSDANLIQDAIAEKVSSSSQSLNFNIANVRAMIHITTGDHQHSLLNLFNRSQIHMLTLRPTAGHRPSTVLYVNF